MNNSLQQEFTKYSDKFLTLTMREQLLILLCGAAVVTLLAYTLLLAPVIDSSTNLDKRVKNITAEITSLSEQVAQLSVKLKEDPDAPVQARISALREQIKGLNDQLLAHTDNLVPASKMANMLESVLVDSKKLKLLELQSIAPIPILMDDEEKLETGLYRHGVAMVFEGSYFDIQQYLAKLESLPWQFYWKKFDYLVSEYPTATVKLEIYTLSTNKAFIGI